MFNKGKHDIEMPTSVNIYRPLMNFCKQLSKNESELLTGTGLNFATIDISTSFFFLKL